MPPLLRRRLRVETYDCVAVVVTTTDPKSGAWHKHLYNSTRLQAHNFALEGPIVGIAYQTGSDWVFQNVVPLGGITFPVSNQMIKESRLPVRRSFRDLSGKFT